MLGEISLNVLFLKKWDRRLVQILSVHACVWVYVKDLKENIIYLFVCLVFYCMYVGMCGGHKATITSGQQAHQQVPSPSGASWRLKEGRIFGVPWN